MRRKHGTCPRCSAQKASRDGYTRSGKQRYRCKVCGKSYISVRDGVRPVVREIATALIMAGIPVSTIAMAMHMHCSRRTLYTIKADLLRG